MEIRRMGGEIPNIFEEQPAEAGQEVQQIGQPGLLGTSDLIEQIGLGENIGTSTQALTGGGDTRLPNVEDSNVPPGMPYLQQGSANACGTTSLAMIMSYLGVPESKGDIDNAIRRTDIFTSPEDILKFARSKGLEAEEYNNGTWDELKSQIDAGHPCEVLIKSDPALGGSADGLHYVDITGHGTDPATGQEYVLFHDPNRGTEQKMSVNNFMTEWGNADLPPGVHNFYMAFGKSGDNLPPSRVDGLESSLGATEGITNFMNGGDRLIHPDNFGSFVHGIPQVVGGVVQTLGCGVGEGFQWLGQHLNSWTDGIPVLSNIVQPFGDVLNGVGAVVGDVFNGVGNACNDVGGAFDSLFNGDFGGFASGLGNSVGDVAGGVVSAVGDAVSAVGNAVSDFFSGW